MENLFKMYRNQCVTGGNEHKLFLRFFSDETNRHNIEQCLDLIMNREQLKSDDIANKLRCDGNIFYKNRNFSKSLHTYTLALCNAIPGSESYGLILANRSAVFFMLKRYSECISDIQNGLKANCPDATKLKLYIRKVKCCYNTNPEKCKNAVLEALDYLNSSNGIADKTSLEIEIMSYCKKTSYQFTAEGKLHDEEIPSIKDGFSDRFLYASNAIGLRYDKGRGRHVRAKGTIHPGDVLFVEKPFIFAPVFTNANMRLHWNKCYNCLRTVYSCLPCRSCTNCIFCNENCLSVSWNESHKWECRGMRSNLWYHIGIAFPALRALVRGIPTGLLIPSNDCESDVINYGDKNNNYLYFNRLLTNIDKMKNVLPLILCAATIVSYLETYTDFFSWLLKQPVCPKQNRNDLMIHVGALLLRHIAQLQCNSSVIKHSDLESDDDSIACAIYPSVSMMNHSCKPNITISYVNDLVVVRATETIQPDEEIFNCYGIDYRYLDRNSRQEQCSSLYFFNCECRACKTENT